MGIDTIYRRCMLLLTAIAASVAHAANAGHDHSPAATAVFLSATGTTRSGTLPADVASSDAAVAVDLLIGRKRGRWRFLSEIFAESDELDIERLQLGFETSSASLLWLGRFHQPSSVWNIFYHHGAYLQTGVSRPWLDAWEDEHGVVAQHIDGALFETQLPLANDHALGLSVGAGLAPTFKQTGFVPHDQAGRRVPGSSNRHVSLRLQWMPDPVGDDMVGLLAAHSKLPVRRDDAQFGRTLEQQSVGAFGSWSWNRTRLVGVLMHVNIRADARATATMRGFTAAYAEIDQSVRPAIQLYGRVEALDASSSDGYLQQFAGTEPRRLLAGARFDLPHKNALKLELGRMQPLVGQWHGAISLQWSAVVP